MGAERKTWRIPNLQSGEDSQRQGECPFCAEPVEGCVGSRISIN